MLNFIKVADNFANIGHANRAQVLSAPYLGYFSPGL